MSRYEAVAVHPDGQHIICEDDNDLDLLKRLGREILNQNPTILKVLIYDAGDLRVTLLNKKG